MTVRELVYPTFNAESMPGEGGGDVRLRFRAPGSKFGPVHVVLTADDAETLASLIDMAVERSNAMLAAERET